MQTEVERLFYKANAAWKKSEETYHQNVDDLYEALCCAWDFIFEYDEQIWEWTKE